MAGFLLAVAVSAVLCGCNKPEALENRAVTSSDLRLCNITSDGRMAEVESGYYIQYFGTLYFSDKSDLGNWVQVCNDPSCEHKYMTCPSSVIYAFYLNGDRIYTLRNPYDFDSRDEDCDAIYSMAMDGTDLRLEYKVPGSNRGNGGASMAVVKPEQIYGCYSILQTDGTYCNQIVRADAVNSVVLYSGESADRATCFLASASSLFGMRGDLTIYSDMLAGTDELMQHLYIPTENGLEEICGICDYDLQGAYLAGDQLFRFVPNDGYYTTELSGESSRRRMSAQLQDSVAYHFSDQCIVETNLLMGRAPETPEVLVYNGNAWRTVGLSDFVWPGENAAFYPLALSTEYIFFCGG